jgi:hypothetical protein
MKRNKISSGLNQLLSREQVRHFETSPEVFVENPSVVNNYFNLFYQAQLTEIANH